MIPTPIAVTAGEEFRVYPKTGRVEVILECPICHTTTRAATIIPALKEAEK